MLTTALIVIPFGGALLLWLLPWRTSVSAGGFALLVALGELALWVGALANFDFVPGLQMSAEQVWFSDLGVSYKVGLYDWSLWLVGLTALVSVAALGYGLWAGRTRAARVLRPHALPRGSDDRRVRRPGLLLFYVFFEAMLIPLYALIGGWGGAGRLGATIKFIVYTMAGSLLMLVAIIALGLEAGSFDMSDLAEVDNEWIFLGFLAAFFVKAPVFPFHGWLPDAYREAPAEVSALLSGVVSKTAAYGILRIVLPTFPEPVADWRTPARPCLDRARVRVAARVPRAGRARRDRVLEPGADVPDRDRALRVQRLRASRARSSRWSSTVSSRPRSSCSQADRAAHLDR